MRGGMWTVVGVSPHRRGPRCDLFASEVLFQLRPAFFCLIPAVLRVNSSDVAIDCQLQSQSLPKMSIQDCTVFASVQYNAFPQ